MSPLLFDNHGSQLDASEPPAVAVRLAHAGQEKPNEGLGRTGGVMRKLLGWVGAILGSSVGWWAGGRVGITTAVLVSAVGTGVGLYLGWWAAERLLD